MILDNTIVRLHFRKRQCSFHVMRPAKEEMLENDLVNIANPLQQVAGREPEAEPLFLCHVPSLLATVHRNPDGPPQANNHLEPEEAPGTKQNLKHKQGLRAVAEWRAAMRAGICR